MIHNSSQDPVFIKKIALRIWTLRSEVEHIVKDNLKRCGNDISSLDLDEVVQEYSAGPKPSTVFEAHEDDDHAIVDDSTVLSEVAEGAESAEDAEGDATEKEKDPDDNVVPIDKQSEDPSQGLTIKQRRPAIPQNELIHAKTLLSEVDMEKMFFFCSKPLIEGQAVIIEFLIPKNFILNAQILYCRPYNMRSRVISKGKLPYRACIKFSFVKKGERTLLRQFVQSIKPNETGSAKAQKKAASARKDADSDLDAFADLDNL
ncbi:MAG: hypothetical protein ISR65_14215 [Bacteriovoracaceae bacterium]|nr:hypothetical protein [Bacteriovoracaceae bacterium]